MAGHGKAGIRIKITSKIRKRIKSKIKSKSRIGRRTSCDSGKCLWKARRVRLRRHHEQDQIIRTLDRGEHVRGGGVVVVVQSPFGAAGCACAGEREWQR